MLTMEDNIQSLISMGFVDRDLNRKALIKANNDISEAVSFLTSSTYYGDDALMPTETMTSTFIGPLTREQLEQQQQQQTVSIRKIKRNVTEKDDKKRKRKMKRFLFFGVCFIYFCRLTSNGASKKKDS